MNSNDKIALAALAVKRALRPGKAAYAVNSTRLCPPADFIRDEMYERNWRAVALAEHSGLSLETVVGLLQGQEPITQDVANGIAKAFGTSAEVWMHLDAAYQSARKEL